MADLSYRWDSMFSGLEILAAFADLTLALFSLDVLVLSLEAAAVLVWVITGCKLAPVSSDVTKYFSHNPI